MSQTAQLIYTLWILFVSVVVMTCVLPSFFCLSYITATAAPLRSSRNANKDIIIKCVKNRPSDESKKEIGDLKKTKKNIILEKKVIEAECIFIWIFFYTNFCYMYIINSIFIFFFVVEKIKIFGFSLWIIFWIL